MKTLRLLMIWAACCVTGTSWAAEPPASKPATPAATPATPAAKPATAAAKPAAGESAAPKADEQTKAQQGTKDEEDEAAAKAPAKPKASGKSPERFVPSEQVRADFDVSFPVDI